jgi:aspartyl-tRNA(Asn)/glutamyl-tRNA(Gln) amidotransferase subunit C
MEVNKQLVDKIAALAKLEFDEAAKEAIRQDLEKMIGFVEKLNELNTDQVEPLIYITEELNILREDEVKQTITKQEALMNAPQKDADYFKVPKVIRKEK